MVSSIPGQAMYPMCMEGLDVSKRARNYLRCIMKKTSKYLLKYVCVCPKCSPFWISLLLFSPLFHYSSHPKTNQPESSFSHTSIPQNPYFTQDISSISLSQGKSLYLFGSSLYLVYPSLWIVPWLSFNYTKYPLMT